MALLLPLADCHPKPPPLAMPHYQLGQPYQADGVWQYPREDFSSVETGLAEVSARRPGELTADGEAYDPDAIAAGHPTLQLPAMARITDLETGRQLVVRVNDRGPARRGRLIAVTPRVASLLGMSARPAQVRVEILPGESHRLVDDLGGGPMLAIRAAPSGVVETTPLPAPGEAPTGAATAVAAPTVPDRPAAPLPAPTGEVTQLTPMPGLLWIEGGTFSGRGAAEEQRARLGAGAMIETHANGRSRNFRVIAGPFDDVTTADAAFDNALAVGVAEARIFVE
jgi:rare lipoprotein A